VLLEKYKSSFVKKEDVTVIIECICNLVNFKLSSMFTVWIHCESILLLKWSVLEKWNISCIPYIALNSCASCKNVSTVTYVCCWKTFLLLPWLSSKFLSLFILFSLCQNSSQNLLDLFASQRIRWSKYYCKNILEHIKACDANKPTIAIK